MIESKDAERKDTGSNSNIASLSEWVENELVLTKRLVTDNYQLFMEAFLAWKFEHLPTSSSSAKQHSKSNLLCAAAVEIAERLERIQVSLEHFEFCKMLSKGAFGEVFLVQERTSGKYYAIKVLKKLDMLNQRDTAFFLEECEIMQRARQSKWLMSAVCVFQDAFNLYFVMNYYSSGDLMTMMCGRESGMLEEYETRFYAAELVLAIEELHSMGFVHRDIKPDNLLIGSDGHIKLTDFGSCGRLVDGKINSRSTVGTPDYISPEVLLTKEEGHEAYGVECDVWSFGVVLYEMLFGNPPFFSDSLLQTYAAIINHKKTLKFPENVEISSAAHDLLSRVLTERASRLSIVHIKQHEFFAGIQWETIHKEIPPYIPIKRNENDYSAFQDTCSDNIAIPNVRIPANSQSYFIGCCALTDGIAGYPALQTQMPAETENVFIGSQFSCSTSLLNTSPSLPKTQSTISYSYKLPSSSIMSKNLSASNMSIGNKTLFQTGKIPQSMSFFPVFDTIQNGSSSMLHSATSSRLSSSNCPVLMTSSSSFLTIAKEDKKQLKLLHQEYKSLEQRYNEEFLRRQQLETQLESLMLENQSLKSNSASVSNSIPTCLVEELVMNEFISTDFVIPSANSNNFQKSIDFLGLFKKQTTVHFSNGKLVIGNKHKSKSAGNLDFLLDFTDKSFVLRAYKKDSHYIIDLVKFGIHSTLSNEDSQFKLSKSNELLQREENIQRTLKSLIATLSDPKHKTNSQLDLQFSEIKAYFYAQERNHLSLQKDESVAYFTESFNGHSFQSKSLTSSSTLTINSVKSSSQSKCKNLLTEEWECFVCGKFAPLLGSRSSKLLYSCGCCGCKCHYDCIPFLRMKCEDYEKFCRKEAFFTLSTKVKDSYYKLCHLIDLSIKLQM